MIRTAIKDSLFDHSIDVYRTPSRPLCMHIIISSSVKVEVKVPPQFKKEPTIETNLSTFHRVHKGNLSNQYHLFIWLRFVFLNEREEDGNHRRCRVIDRFREPFFSPRVGGQSRYEYTDKKNGKEKERERENVGCIVWPPAPFFFGTLDWKDEKQETRLKEEAPQVKSLDENAKAKLGIAPDYRADHSWNEHLNKTFDVIYPSFYSRIMSWSCMK